MSATICQLLALFAIYICSHSVSAGEKSFLARSCWSQSQYCSAGSALADHGSHSLSARYTFTHHISLIQRFFCPCWSFWWSYEVFGDILEVFVVPSEVLLKFCSVLILSVSRSGCLYICDAPLCDPTHCLHLSSCQNYHIEHRAGDSFTNSSQRTNKSR